MTIKPIDIQTNIAHMHEIAKAEHGRSAAFINGEHSLEKSAQEIAVRIKDKLEENKHAEKTTIMREEAGGKKKGKKPHEGKDEGNEEDERESLSKYENIGLKIDVKR